MATKDLPAGLLDLLELERTRWPEIRDRIRLSGHPVCEGEGDGEGEGEGAAGASEDGDAAAAAAAAGEGADWKAHSRKHEREAKAARKRAEELEAKLKEREEADQTEQEKALAKARDEAKAEASSEFNKERRADRLEVATTRIAATGVKVKVTEDGEEREKVLKFADPDDALVYVERAIKAGDIDEDDIFDNEGKVQTDALQTALKDILERKTHLQANGSSSTVVSGSADGGKGSGPTKDEESLSVDERFQRLQKK